MGQRAKRLLSASGFLAALSFQQSLHAEPVGCSDLSVGYEQTFCVAGYGLRLATSLRAHDIEQQRTRTGSRLRLDGVSEIESIGFRGYCVLDHGGVIVCWPTQEREWAAPGILASHIAGWPGTMIGGGVLCANVTTGGVDCFRVRGPTPDFVGHAAAELESLTVNGSYACGIAQGVPTCFSIPLKKPPRGVLTAHFVFSGFEGASPAKAMAARNRLELACAVRDRVVTCHPPAGTPYQIQLPSSGVGITVGRNVACAILERRRSVACWTSMERPSVVLKADSLPEGTGEVIAMEATSDGVCFLRQGGTHCLDAPRLLAGESAAPVVAASEPPPIAEVPPSESSKPPERHPHPHPHPHPQAQSRGISFYGGVPFSFGHGIYKSDRGSASGLWLRLRAVAAFGPEDSLRHHGWALGPYFELAWHPVTGGDRMASPGAGITAIWSVTNTIAVMPSAGWYMQRYPGDVGEHGISAGLFVGLVQHSFGPLMLPIGFRFEVRTGLGDQHERSTLFGGEADALIGAAVPVFIFMWGTSNYDWT